MKLDAILNNAKEYINVKRVLWCGSRRRRKV